MTHQQLVPICLGKTSQRKLWSVSGHRRHCKKLLPCSVKQGRMPAVIENISDPLLEVGFEDDRWLINGLFGQEPGPTARAARRIDSGQGETIEATVQCLGRDQREPVRSPPKPGPSNGIRAAAGPTTSHARLTNINGSAAYPPTGESSSHGTHTMGISQLESGDHRSLGTLHGGRIQHPISHYAVSTSRTIPSSFFTRRGTGSARAAGGVTTEGCHQGSLGPTLLRQHLVSAAEGRQPLASYFQFEESERVCGDVPLQNGDNPPAGRCSDTAQFHVQSRSVRRIPFYPGVYSTSGVSAVPLERTPLELHLPSLRFGGCSSSFYESASPGCEALEGTRGDPPGLSGRLAHYRGQSSGSSECGRGSGRPAGAVRIQSQPEEVHLVSEASSSIFGYGRRCHLDDPQPAQRQIAEVASRMSKPSSPRMGDGSRTSLNLGKDGGGIAGDQSSSPTCSGLAVPLARFSQRHCPSGRMGTARSSVVEREGTFAELQPNHPSSSEQDHHDRCLQLGLGGSLRSCPNNGSMAQRGTVETYQLEGAVCHLPGIDDLCRSGQEYD